MTNAAESHPLSNLAVKVSFYSLGGAVVVFIAMLLLAGVHPW
jgi:hypothetical protein